jgi:orotate phosphoribosyltransferase
MLLTQEQYNQKRLFVKNFINEFCIYRVKPGEPKLPGKLPNTLYTWQFYLRRGLFNHEFLTAVSELFLQKVHEELNTFDFQIAGLETASTPLLAGIPLVAAKYGLDINAFSIRKNRKEYGLLNWIEGRVNNKPIMLIDDLCSSTASLDKAYKVLLSVNLTNILNRAFCVVNKKNVIDRNQPVVDKYLTEEIKVMYLYSLDDFNLTYNMQEVK